MTPSGKFDDTPAEPDAEQCWLPPLPEKRWEAFGILLRLDSTWRAPCQSSFLYWVQFNQINLAGLSTRASWSRGLQPCFAKTGKMVKDFSVFHFMISIFSQRAHNYWLLRKVPSSTVPKVCADPAYRRAAANDHQVVHLYNYWGWKRTFWWILFCWSVVDIVTLHSKAIALLN